LFKTNQSAPLRHVIVANVSDYYGGSATGLSLRYGFTQSWLSLSGYPCFYRFAFRHFYSIRFPWFPW